LDLLAEPAIIAEIKRAWLESQVDDAAKRHEEGGYITLGPDQSLAIERWLRGSQSRILPPPMDRKNCYNGRVVVATFHTHPNPPIDEDGQEWEQSPGESDRRWHARRGLRGFVVTRTFVYEIDAMATVTVVGKHNEVLGP